MTTASTLAFALPLAWAWDIAFGEPRNALHPVAWLGRLLGPIGGRLVRCSAHVAFVGGMAVWLALAVVIGWAAESWQHASTAWPWWLAVPALALVLKPMFAWRMLHEEVAAVNVALDHGLDAARTRLSRIVSRDVSTLDAAMVRETAIETLAENLNDSVVAPLLWYAVFGLPGAAVYRLANTADAMWGYRGRFEWAGKWAARADDLLSWLPARLTGWMLYPPKTVTAWRNLRAQACKTPSPNGGWPMGAMALRLGVCLRKPGVYALNEAASPPGAPEFKRALLAARRSAWMAAAAATLVWWLRA